MDFGILKKLKRKVEKDIDTGDIDKLKNRLSRKKYEDLINSDYVVVDFLEYSLKMDKFNIFEFLMNYSGFDVDTQFLNGDDFTLLMKIINRNMKIEQRISRILNHTKNINLMNNNGETALYLAVDSYYEIKYGNGYYENEEREHRNIIVELLKHGAKANSIMIENLENQILGDFVIRDGMIDVLKLILEHSKHDITAEALCLAIHYKKYDCVEILLNYVKDINKPIHDGMTALQFALTRDKRDEDIIELLRASL